MWDSLAKIAGAARGGDLSGDGAWTWGVLGRRSVWAPRAASDDGELGGGREPPRGRVGAGPNQKKKRKLALGLGGRWDARGTDRLDHGVEAARSTHHIDAFVFRDGSDFENDVVGLNGQLASTAIDDDRKLDVGGTTIVQHGVDGCAGGAPRVQHVIDDHHVAAIE